MPGSKPEKDLVQQRTSALMEASDTLIRKARQLREQSQNLRQNSPDMREFMREALLTLYSKREHWYSS